MSANLKAKMCESLALTLSELDELAHTAPGRYKVYPIKKKSGGSRTICQPAQEVKFVQKFLIKKYLSHYAIHNCATAYVEGSSAYKNSLRHSGNSYIIKIDFKNFFNSIKAQDFENFIEKNNIFKFTKEEIKILSYFLFWWDRYTKQLVLSIGAPSSPIVSNIMLLPFDLVIDEFCKKKSCVYTRYADDITLSSKAKNNLMECYEFLLAHISQAGISSLSINQQKTKFLSKKGKRIVTGYIISNEGKSSLGREKKRQIRAMIHGALLKARPDSLSKINYIVGILGHVGFSDQVFWSSLEETYGQDFFKKLLDIQAKQIDKPKMSKATILDILKSLDLKK